MAYKISKGSILKEQIELDNGNILDIHINIGKMANTINALYNNLILCINKSKKNKSMEILEELGKSGIALIETVLGSDNAKILLDYFDEDYYALLNEVLPFIDNVILPRLKEVKKEKKRIAKENYYYTKKR